MSEDLNNSVNRKINIGLLKLNSNYILKKEDISKIDTILNSEKIKEFKNTIKKNLSNEYEDINLSVTIEKNTVNIFSEILNEYNITLYKDDNNLQEIVDVLENKTESYFAPKEAGKEKKRRIFQRHKIIIFKHPEFFEQNKENELFFGIILSESTQGISYNFGALERHINDYISENEDITINTHLGFEKIINHKGLEKLFKGEIQGIDINLTSNNWLSYQSLNNTLGLNGSDENEEFDNTPINNNDLNQTNNTDLELKMKFIVESSKNQKFYQKVGGYFKEIVSNIGKNKKDIKGKTEALYGNIKFKDGNSWYSLFDLALNFTFLCKIEEEKYPRLIVANTDSKFFFGNITDRFLRKFDFLNGDKINIEKIFNILNTLENDKEDIIL